MHTDSLSSDDRYTSLSEAGSASRDKWSLCDVIILVCLLTWRYRHSVLYIRTDAMNSCEYVWVCQSVGLWFTWHALDWWGVFDVVLQDLKLWSGAWQRWHYVRLHQEIWHIQYHVSARNHTNIIATCSLCTHILILLSKRIDSLLLE